MQEPSVSSSSPAPVLVVGAGVAGLQAALDLARLGVPVELADRHDHLGGQVMRLDKVYPTDHCAFCPVWPLAKACLDHPLISVRLQTTVTDIMPEGDRFTATLHSQSPAVSPEACVFCGRCLPTCTKGALSERHPLLTWDPSRPPVVRLDQSRCDRCGACVAACPAGAIDLSASVQDCTLEVADVILATGFEEPSPSPVPEFGAYTHPDIRTAMEFENWSAEHRVNGPVCRPSTGQIACSVAFVQCAGARDRRHLAYCAAVCCMHAAKQARWLKRRQPDTTCVLFYTDLRAPGKAQESYIRSAREAGVTCIRVRPGLVLGTPDAGAVVRYEDPATGRVVTDGFDMVVLNGGLAQCPLPKATAAAVPASAERRCGFCEAPGDIAQSVVQADRTAALVAKRLGVTPIASGDVL